MPIIQFTLYMDSTVQTISAPFEHCIFCNSAFSIIGKNFLWVELHANCTAQNTLSPKAVWALCASLRTQFHASLWNMQCSNRTEIDCMCSSLFCGQFNSSLGLSVPVIEGTEPQAKDACSFTGLLYTLVLFAASIPTFPPSFSGRKSGS